MDKTSWNAAALRLLEETKKGAISWRRQSCASFDIYSCWIMGKYIRIVVYDPIVDRLDADTVIEFVDQIGRVQWRWPWTHYTEELGAVVKNRVDKPPVFVQEFLGTFLG